MSNHVKIFSIRIVDIANTFGFIFLVWILFGKETISYFIFISSFIVPLQSFVLSRNVEYMVASENRASQAVKHIEIITVAFSAAALLFFISGLGQGNLAKIALCFVYKYTESMDEICRAYFISSRRLERVLLQSISRGALLVAACLGLYMWPNFELQSLSQSIYPFFAISLAYCVSFCSFSLGLTVKLLVRERHSASELIHYLSTISSGGVTNLLTSLTAILPRVYLGFFGSPAAILYFTLSYQIAATLVNIFALNMSTHASALREFSEGKVARRFVAAAITLSLAIVPIMLAYITDVMIQLPIITIAMFLALLVRTGVITSESSQILNSRSVFANLAGIVASLLVTALVKISAIGDNYLLEAYLFVAVSCASSIVLMQRRKG